MKWNKRGFTLLEIMIALVIFVILGVLTAMALRSVLRSHQHVKRVDRGLQQVELAMVIIGRDISQIIDRPTVGMGGVKNAAFEANSSRSVAFTRAGLANPLAMQARTGMQRVIYQIEHNKLMRLTWATLDHPSSMLLQKTVLLSGVSQLQIQFVNQYGQVVNAWVSGGNIQFPRAIVVTLRLGRFGQIRRIFPIPGVGMMYAQN